MLLADVIDKIAMKHLVNDLVHSCPHSCWDYLVELLCPKDHISSILVDDIKILSKVVVPNILHSQCGKEWLFHIFNHLVSV